jgi:hypothetical protein
MAGFDGVTTLLNDVLTGMGSAGVSVAPLDFYCDPSGSDSNAGTLAAPLRHPGAAMARIPKRLRHMATVHLAPGHFNGFAIVGFTFEPLLDGTPVGIAIRGTLVDAAIATGRVSGTSTSAANGSNSAPAWATLSDSTQTWTTNDLRGRFLEITSGPGAGQIHVIAGNTATDISITGTTWTAPVASGYVIRDEGSIVDVPIQIAGSVPVADGVASPPVNAGIAVAANLGAPMNASYIRIDAVKITLTGRPSAAGIRVDPPITISRCSFAQDAGVCVLAGGPGGALRIQHCVFQTLSASVTGVVMGGSSLGSPPASGAVLNSLFVNGFQGPAMMAVGGGNNLVVSNCESSFTTGINMIGPCSVILTGGLKFVCDGSSSQQLKARIQNNSPGGCYVLLASGSGCDISGASRSSAVELEGPHAAIFNGNLNGSGSATAIRISQGARIRLSAGSTITAAEEIVMDGAPGQTIASMRAASPRVLSNAYGTIVYE